MTSADFDYCDTVYKGDKDNSFAALLGKRFVGSELSCLKVLKGEGAADAEYYQGAEKP
jgi:hypothetical protein